MGDEQKNETETGIGYIEYVFKMSLLFVMAGLVLLFLYISCESAKEGLLIPAGTIGGVGVCGVISATVAWAVKQTQKPKVKDEEINKKMDKNG